MAGLTLPTIAGILAACGSDSGSSASTAPGSVKVGTQAVVTPAASGPLDSATWGLSYEPSSLNWLLAYAPSENIVIANVTESLMQFTPDFKQVPGLAEKYDTPDPTTYVFTIRQGVKFHDGSDMTTDDVVGSLNHSLDPTSFWAPWLTTVKNVEKTGDSEVTVHLKEPDELFIQVMALPAGAVGPIAKIKAAGEAYGTPKSLPIGTGPFKVDSWSAGTSISLSKFDDYWDTKNPAKTTKLDFSFLGDSGAMINSLESGQVDGAYNLPYEALTPLINSSNGTLYSGPTMMQALMFFTTKPGPLQDEKVRRAWLMATDRNSIAKNAYSNAATPLPSTFVPLSVWSYDKADAKKAYDALPGPEGDLAGAKKLFKEAGAPSQKVQVVVQATALDEQVGTLLQASAKSIGLNVEIIKLPTQQQVNLFYDTKARIKYDAVVGTNYYSDMPDPVDLFFLLLAPASPGALSYNYNDYSDKTVQDLILKARQTSDPDQRGSMIIDAQKQAAPQVPVFPIVAPDSLVFLGKRVSGVPASWCYNYYPWARDLGAA